MGKALDGVRILDMTHVQSGPTCTQILAWFGADVIKVERPGEGDPTRGQLRDIPGVDSLYFTMLNGNKRAITLNPKTEAGNKIFAKLIEKSDVMVENYAPGAIDRMGVLRQPLGLRDDHLVDHLPDLLRRADGANQGVVQHCQLQEVEIAGGGHAPFLGHADLVAAEVERFMQALPEAAA